jgi:hypothetical protein
MKSLAERKMLREERRRKLEYKEGKWRAFFDALFDVLILLSEGLIRLGSKLVNAIFKIVD